MINSPEELNGQQLSCLVLIDSLYSVSDKHHPPLEISDTTRRELILFLLELVKLHNVDITALFQLIENEVQDGKVVVRVLYSRLQLMCEEGHPALMNFFEPDVSLLTTDNSPLHDSSILGLFVRKCLVQYHLMTFEESYDLYIKLMDYVNDYNPELSSASPMDLDETEADSCHVIRRVIPDYIDYLPDAKISAPEKFISKQIMLIEKQSPEAFSPDDITSYTESLKERFPHYHKTHFLDYLNALRTKDVQKATLELQLYFDRDNTTLSQTRLGEKQNEIENNFTKFSQYRYCNLCTGMLNARLGHKEASLMALKEACRMAQETNDSQCLQHASYWLHWLSLKYDEDTAHGTIDSFVENAKLQQQRELYVLGTLLRSKKSAFLHQKSPSDNLEDIDDILVVSALIANKVLLHKGALLNFYGNRAMASLVCQSVISRCNFDLAIGSFDKDTQFDHCNVVDGETFTLSSCHLIAQLTDEGYYEECEKLYDLASKSTPVWSSVYDILNLSAAQNLFTQSIFSRDLDKSQQLASQISTVDPDNGRLRYCAIDILRNNFDRSLETIDGYLNKKSILNQCEISETPQPIFVCNLLLLKAEILICSLQVSNAIETALKCLVLARQASCGNEIRSAVLLLTHCQLSLGLVHEATELIESYMLNILTHGTRYHRAIGKFLLAKCQFASKNDSRIRLKLLKSETISLLESCCLDLFSVGANSKLKAAKCLQACVYDELGFVKERNTAASDALKLSSELLPSISETCLL